MNQAPRVMMVVRLFAPWIGGTERQAHNLSIALQRRGTDVQVATGRWFRGTARQELMEGVPVYRHHTLWEFFGVKGLRKFGGYLYIVTLMWHLFRRRREYDVIHVHGLNYHTFAAVLAGRRLGKPVLTKLANSGPASDIEKMRHNRQLAGARFMLRTALRCDRFVALSETIVGELLAAGVERTRIVLLPNGVEIEEAIMRSDYDIAGPLRLLFLGRLHPNKGLDTLVKAVAIADARSPGDVTATLVGDGPERDSLVRLAGIKGVRDTIEFPGATSDVSTHLGEADVFVLPSRAEGISNALLEAMATGLPVIVSDTPGNTAVITHDDDGLVFPVGDAVSLAGHIARLRTDADLRRRLGGAARACVDERYSFEVVAAAYLKLYRQMVGDRSVAAFAEEATS